MSESVIIIGSGLGGLECGLILARHGFNVTVLEKHRHIGGCLQTFRRGGYRDEEGARHDFQVFDSGFHYVGGLGEGQSLRPLFEYYGLMDLPWRQLDEDCFDEVCIGERSFPFASGHSRFVERLVEFFPHERENLGKYAAFLKGVGDNIFRAFEPDSPMNALFGRSAYDFLCETISDPLLRKVLSGTSLKLELSADTLPLYVFAQINNSFIQSAWRLDGGGGQIALALASQIVNAGGEVLTGTEVISMKEENGRISRLTLATGETLSADYVISDVHPAVTLSLVEDTKCLRRIYRNRIAGLPNTFGMFTANVCLKKDALPYLNRNLYVHREDADLWHPDPGRTESVLVHYYPVDTEYASHIDLISPMSWQSVSQWRSLPVGHRGEEYERIKAEKARECIDLVSTRIPQLRDCIESLSDSTPLTYHNYTATPFGSAYGVRKDWTSSMTTVLSPRSPIPNLLFTGQSLNLHGILGVSMTSVMTCMEILGRELYKEILRQA